MRREARTTARERRAAPGHRPAGARPRPRTRRGFPLLSSTGRRRSASRFRTPRAASMSITSRSWCGSRCIRRWIPIPHTSGMSSWRRRGASGSTCARTRPPGTCFAWAGSFTATPPTRSPGRGSSRATPSHGQSPPTTARTCGHTSPTGTAPTSPSTGALPRRAPWIRVQPSPASTRTWWSAPSTGRDTLPAGAARMRMLRRSSTARCRDSSCTAPRSRSVRSPRSSRARVRARSQAPCTHTSSSGRS